MPSRQNVRTAFILGASTVAAIVLLVVAIIFGKDRFLSSVDEPSRQDLEGQAILQSPLASAALISQNFTCNPISGISTLAVEQVWSSVSSNAEIIAAYRNSATANGWVLVTDESLEVAPPLPGGHLIFQKPFGDVSIDFWLSVSEEDTTPGTSFNVSVHAVSLRDVCND